MLCALKGLMLSYVTQLILFIKTDSWINAGHQQTTVTKHRWYNVLRPVLLISKVFLFYVFIFVSFVVLCTVLPFYRERQNVVATTKINTFIDTLLNTLVITLITLNLRQSYILNFVCFTGKQISDLKSSICFLTLYGSLYSINW